MVTSRKRYTNFRFGFDIMGKRTSQTGESMVGIYKAPTGWDGSTVYEGTPIQIDTSNAGYIKECADGEEPEGLLFSRVSDELTDFEWLENLVARDEVQAGDPVSYLIYSKNAIIETKLFADGYTPVAGDELYVSGRKFSDTDPLAGSGVVVGEVKSYDSNTGYGIVIMK